ncbi:MAG: matrixin family metalloprotease [Planctomycetes bacterium]|nr:matrixin family metalloprotease [Planctomycetota bacterium]
MIRTTTLLLALGFAMVATNAGRAMGLPAPISTPHVLTIETSGGSSGAVSVFSGSTAFVFDAGILTGYPNVAPGSNPRQAINAAAASWTAVSTLSYTDAGTTSAASASNNGSNLVTFANTSSNASVSAGTIAVTLYFYDGSFGLTDTDIVFNPTQNFSTLGTTGFHDVQSVATHEFGHAFGLSHSPITTSSMFAALTVGSQEARSLSPDDVAAINQKYLTIPNFFAWGAITGTVTKPASGPVYGAHIVARSLVTGVTVSSTISRPDGSYTLYGLPAGPYRVYAEPLDGPSFDNHVVTSFWTTGKDTSFPTLFSGGNASPAVVRVRATQITTNVDFSLGTAAPTINISLLGQTNSPTAGFSAANTGISLRAGQSTFLVVGGAGVNLLPDAAFRVSGAGVTRGSSASSGLFSNGLGFKVFPLSALAQAEPGPRDLEVTVGNEVSIFCGGIDILPPTTATARATTYGTGCAGSAGALSLGTFGGLPSLGNLAFGVTSVNTVAGNTWLLLISGRPDVFDIGSGCTIWVDINTLVFPANAFQATASSSTRNQALSIPSSPSLAGLTIYLQALAQDPQAALGFTASNGLALTLN